MSKITDLEKQIKEAASAYYNGHSIMEDDEYDALVYELSCLDPNNKILNNIGAEVTDKSWEKSKHIYPLGSLNKVNLPEEMSNWITNDIKNHSVVVSDKLDGLSIGCQYDDGKLIKASLRGNGIEGENILTNILKMKGVVTNIPNFNGVIRGEILLFKSDYNEYFTNKANPRNAASGICRRLDGVGCEHLTVVFYDVMGKDFSTELEKFKFLEESGCKVPKYKLCNNASEVNKLWQDYQDTVRDKLEYMIDGIVVACNDVDFQVSCGMVGLKPKGKIAFKFANQFVKTTVKDIKWFTGNSGRVTPVCIFDQVNLLGSKVQKASVYNIAYIEKLGLNIGAEVLICKANDIIPRVEKIVKPAESTYIIPNTCPSCGEVLTLVGENLMCTNSLNCPAQITGRIENWIKELNILEWGSTLIQKLVDSGKVNTIADLYTLTVEDLSNIDRMGKKSAQKCYDNLWNKKEIPLDLFIGGLSIPMIGSSTIRQIMNIGCDTIDKFYQLKSEQFQDVPKVGPIKAECLANGLQQSKFIVDRLFELGVKIKDKVSGGKLDGKSVNFTGTMINKRAVLEQMVVDNGGSVKSVGKDLTYLVVDDVDSTTTKIQKAKKLGIKLITEDEFLNLLK